MYASMYVCIYRSIYLSISVCSNLSIYLSQFVFIHLLVRQTEIDRYLDESIEFEHIDVDHEDCDRKIMLRLR